jgi:hypothetical protein
MTINDTKNMIIYFSQKCKAFYKFIMMPKKQRAAIYAARYIEVPPESRLSPGKR